MSKKCYKKRSEDLVKEYVDFGIGFEPTEEDWYDGAVAIAEKCIHAEKLLKELEGILTKHKRHIRILENKLNYQKKKHEQEKHKN